MKMSIPLLPCRRSVFLLLVLLLFCSCSIRPPVEVFKGFARSKTAAADSRCRDCNVLFISMTNLRADHLGMQGYDRDTTPNIDAFAQHASVFLNAFSVASWTLPVAMSVYTATYPFDHGVMTRRTKSGLGGATRNRLPPERVTLVDILRRHGYVSVSFNGARDYRVFHGLTSRFDHNESFTLNNEVEDFTGVWSRYGYFKDVVPAARDWLRENRGRKFFMHLQAYDLHCPFAYPEEHDRFDPDYEGDVDFANCYWTFDRTEPVTITPEGGTPKQYYLLKSRANDGIVDPRPLGRRDIEHMVALYDGEIHSSDRYIAQILEEVLALGLADRTLIVLFSEHGDMLGKYGRFMRGGPLRGSFYDDVLHVPLVIYHPGMPPARIEHPVSLVDIAPTILELLDIEPEASFRGRDLVPLMRGEAPPGPAPLFAGARYTPLIQNDLFNYPTLIASVRQGDWKLIAETRFHAQGTCESGYELFNIRQDPQELDNLRDQETDRLAALTLVLEKWLSQEFGIYDVLRPAATAAGDTFSEATLAPMDREK
jgi:arylsulfatase A-like enzyme